MKNLENNKLFLCKFDEVDENLNTLFGQNKNLKITQKVSLNTLNEQFTKRSQGGPTVVSVKQDIDDLNSNYSRFKEEVLKRFEDENERLSIIVKNFKENKHSSNDNSNLEEINSVIDEKLGILKTSINEIKQTEKHFIDNLSKKMEKEDLQKLYKTITQDIDKSITKVITNSHNNKQELLKQLSFIKNNSNGREDESAVNNNQTEDQGDIEIFRIFEEKIDTNTKELGKLLHSFTEMKEKVNLLDPEKINGGIFRISNLEDGLRMLQLKKKNSIMMNQQQIISNMQGTNNNSIEDSEDREIMTLINNLTRELKEKFKIINNRIDVISNKLDNLSGELLGKLKKDLGNESNRILEEFKVNLKNSMSRIEDKLNEKVDRLNLDEIARRIDAKISLEMGRKLDKTDLKKNTSIMNKKIENLENKISKTLVDTLIDLQLDDAPLIVKKTAQAEKCGSCNQHLPITGPNQGNSLFSSHANLNYDNAFAGSKQKTKTRNAINNVVSNTEIDEKILKTSSNLNNYKTSTVMNMTQLPEIKEKSEKKKNINLNDGKTHSFENKSFRSISVQYQNSNNIKTKENNTKDLIKYNEVADRQINKMLNEELDKQFINPDTLLRATNKIFDSNIEKKKHT